MFKRTSIITFFLQRHFLINADVVHKIWFSCVGIDRLASRTCATKVGFFQVMHMQIVAFISRHFARFQGKIKSMEVGIFKWNVFHVQVVYQLMNSFVSTQFFARRHFKQHFYLTPYSSSFFGMNFTKGQRDVRSTNCSFTVNESFHQYFHCHMNANVWKPAPIAVNRSAPGPVQPRFGLSSYSNSLEKQ